MTRGEGFQGDCDIGWRCEVKRRTGIPAMLFAAAAASGLLSALGCGGPEEMWRQYNHGPKPAFSAESEISQAKMNGKECLQRGKNLDAVKWFTLLLSIESGNYEGFSGRGQALYLLGQYERCLGDFDRALTANSSDYRIFGFRGQAKYKVNHSAGAIEDLTQAIKLNANAGWLYETRAKAYDAVGRIDLAREDRKKFNELGG